MTTLMMGLPSYESLDLLIDLKKEKKTGEKHFCTGTNIKRTYNETRNVTRKQPYSMGGGLSVSGIRD